MAGRPDTTYAYTIKDLASQSGWDVNRIHQDVSRGKLNATKIDEVAVWLATNGSPEIRRRMAEALLPVILDGLRDFICHHLLPGIFKDDQAERLQRATKISKGKRRKPT